MRLERTPHVVRVLLCVAAVAAVTALIHGLDEFAPVLSLAALYLFAVVPIAILWGVAYAAGTSLLCMLAFNFFHLPPLHSLTLSDSENWIALVVYLVVAIVVGELAARVRQRAAEAEQREQEEALLADVATTFLSGRRVEDELDTLAARVAEVLRADAARIELGAQRDPPLGESPHELRAAGERIGTLYVREGPDSNLAIRRRFLPALASLLAVAAAHERLAHEALEAEALRKSDTIRTAVLRAVSHDLHSPLTAIITAVQTLRSPALHLAEEDRASMLETIETEATRLERLVRDLLDLSRLQAETAEPTQELWTIDELVGQALTDLGACAERVEVVIPADLPPVRADASQLRRVLANLLENALRFSPAGETVAIRATATRREVVVRIVDHGPGIAASELERIFEPFYRTAGAVDVRGSGFGLAIARGFVTANGGRVWAESRPGQGSIVRRGACVGARSRAGRLVTGARILVVDDEPQILRALRATLRGAGYEVETAATATEALTMAAVRPPDGVILDLVLPDGTGTEVTRSLRAWTQIPILILSAVGEKPRRSRRSTRVPTTTSRSPSASTSSWRASAPRCAGSPLRQSPSCSWRELEIDLEKRSVRRNGELLAMTPLEFGILRLLALNLGKLMTHRMILKEVWGPAYQSESHYLHVYVSQLRRKIEDDPARPRYLLTEPGAGYRLVEPTD